MNNLSQKDLKLEIASAVEELRMFEKENYTLLNANYKDFIGHENSTKLMREKSDLFLKHQKLDNKIFLLKHELEILEIKQGLEFDGGAKLLDIKFGDIDFTIKYVPDDNNWFDYFDVFIGANNVTDILNNSTIESLQELTLEKHGEE